ncbi:carbohydrate ABC transporter permease [Chloroflexi bacterium TSY]|nr:carbohydrate ABC transporter permease [Chloroflexi bacterium TSY]MBV7333246.1 carbohydrate ABC transporter permease [Chloroflexi bacterium TSY]
MRRVVENGLLYLLLFGFAILVGIPFLYMITGAFKTNGEIFNYPVTIWVQNPTLNNYQRLLSGEEVPYLRQMGNSAIIAVFQTLLTLLIASMVGWGFAKYEFRGRHFLTIFLLATFTIPFQVTLVPLFQLMVNINLLDSFLGVILPSSLSAFGAFFMRQAMVSIPGELLDAGRIDGASEWGLFWRVGLPLSQGALSVLAVLVFLGAWNDYLWPLIVLRSPENFTYPLGLATLNGLYKVEYGMILGGSFIATLPVILIFVAGRKQLLDNLTIGAVKG